MRAPRPDVAPRSAGKKKAEEQAPGDEEYKRGGTKAQIFGHRMVSQAVRSAARPSSRPYNCDGVVNKLLRAMRRQRPTSSYGTARERRMRNRSADGTDVRLRRKRAIPERTGERRLSTQMRLARESALRP